MNNKCYNKNLISIIIIILTTFLAMLGFLYLNIDQYAGNNSKLKVDYIAENRMFIEKVGSGYFNKNFKFHSYSESRPKIQKSAKDIYDYKFLPFTSDVTEYHTSILIDPYSNEVSYYAMPPCVFNEGADRCNFNVQYAEVYQRGKKRLLSDDIYVRLEEDENGTFRWKVSYNDNSFKNWYYVDVNDGTETNIEKTMLW